MSQLPPSGEQSASVSVFLRPFLRKNNHVEGKDVLSAALGRALSQLQLDSLRAVAFQTTVRADNGQHEMLAPLALLEAWAGTLASAPAAADGAKPRPGAVRPVAAAEHGEPTVRRFARFQKIVGALRTLEATNEVLTNGSPLLRSMQARLAAGTVRRLVAFDIEAYEHDQRHLLEVGCAIYHAGVAPPAVATFHFVVQENARWRNGRFCANNRDNFSFGTSEMLPLTQVFDWLWGHLSQPGTVLVGHNLPADLRYLQEARVYRNGVPSGTYPRFTSQWFGQRMQFDTQEAFREAHLRPHVEKLSKVLEHFGFAHDYLHNAGNDAHFTMLAALRLLDLPHGPVAEAKAVAVSAAAIPAPPKAKRPRKVRATEESET